MNFASDNVSGIAPEILQAILAANRGSEPSYGADAATGRLAARFAALFEHEVAVFPMATGTAANALALASVVPPWGIVYCHAEAHIAEDECGAPEFFGGGLRLVGIAGSHGRLDPSDLASRLAAAAGEVHRMQPAAISLTQSTEAGTIYRPEEVAAFGALAHRRGLALHVDGARFANAAAALGCAPADLTWRAGVDVLSFGATKNGAAAAEAVVFFDPAKAAEFAFRRKRGGHLLAKQRFISAQLEAYLTDDLWLRHARHANAMAARLAAGLAGLPGMRLRHPVEANEVFVDVPSALCDHLRTAGFIFHRWDERVGGPPCIRLVAGFDTSPVHVEALIATAHGWAGGAAG